MKECDLVLSGTGAKFGAHVGALQALEELEYKPVRAIGTSGGAIITALYCAGVPIKDMKAIFSQTDVAGLKKFSPWKYPFTGGFYSNSGIETFLDKILLGKTFEDVDMDIRMGAYDIFQKENIILSRDNFPKMKLATAATISASIPHYFGYRKIKEERSGRDLYLVDGGMSINYPIDQFDRVEGRDLIGLWVRSGSSMRPQKHFSTLLYIKNSLTAWQEIISREHIDDAYWANTIPILIEDVSSLDFNLTQSQKDGLIKNGYDSVMSWQERRNGRTDSK